MLTQSSDGVLLRQHYDIKVEDRMDVPKMFTHPNQLFMWSEAALAADMAELSFRAAITAAPRWKLKLGFDSFEQMLKILQGTPSEQWGQRHP